MSYEYIIAYMTDHNCHQNLIDEVNLRIVEKSVDFG